MTKVYFKRINSNTSQEDVSRIAKELLIHTIKHEKVKLYREIPLKVHFGEPGNVTFIGPEYMDGIIDFLEEYKISSSFMETSALYRGKRFEKKQHLETAETHGFSRLPVVITDGDHGENFYEVQIDKKHFEKCKLGKGFEKYNQLIVISHFKGHGLSGFGGALKQLGMGFASKGGKMEMHLGTKPQITKRKCILCGKCKTVCAYDAITIPNKRESEAGVIPHISHNKCVGCGACAAICPTRAASIISFRAGWNAVRGALFGNSFVEQIGEYAYAAHKDRTNIYINFAMNITKGCDCMGKEMKVIMDDIGVFASTDPVAIDKACYDMAMEQGKKFRGRDIFKHAKEIGFGNDEYELVELE